MNSKLAAHYISHVNHKILKQKESLAKTVKYLQYLFMVFLKTSLDDP